MIMVDTMNDWRPQSNMAMPRRKYSLKIPGYGRIFSSNVVQKAREDTEFLDVIKSERPDIFEVLVKKYGFKEDK